MDEIIANMSGIVVKGRDTTVIQSIPSSSKWWCKVLGFIIHLLERQASIAQEDYFAIVDFYKLIQFLDT